MIRTSVSYEGNFKLNIQKAYDLTNQWLNNQYKARIRKNFPLQFIKALNSELIKNQSLLLMTTKSN